MIHDMCFILGYMDIVRNSFSTTQSAEWIEGWMLDNSSKWSGLEEFLMENGATTELSFWRRRE